MGNLQIVYLVFFRCLCLGPVSGAVGQAEKEVGVLDSVPISVSTGYLMSRIYSRKITNRGRRWY